MMSFSRCIVAAGLLIQTAHADLTLKYKSETKANPTLPALMADAIKKQVGTLPSGSTVQVKGDKVFSVWGALTSIVDYAKDQMTVLDPASHRFATVAAADYLAQVNAAMPAEARAAMQNMKVDVHLDKTGNTGEVHGIPVEETVISMSIEMPAAPQAVMRMELHNWTATADALQKFPELKQWNAKKAKWNTATMMSSMFAQGPAGEKLQATLDEIANNSTGLALKTEARVFSPMIVQVLASQGVGSIDGPIVESVMELDSFNADPIPDSVFQVPADYKAAPLADLIRDTFPVKPGQ